MNATLEALKQYESIDALMAAATIEAIPHHYYGTRFSFKVTLPVAPGLVRKADPTFRVATKAQAIEVGREMTRMMLQKAEIGLPGYGVDTRRTIGLAAFLAAPSIDAAYEQATA